MANSCLAEAVTKCIDLRDGWLPGRLRDGKEADPAVYEAVTGLAAAGGTDRPNGQSKGRTGAGLESPWMIYEQSRTGWQ